MAAGAMAAEDHIAAVAAGEDHHVLRALRPGQRRVQIHQHRSHRRCNLSAGMVGASYLPDGAA